MVEAAKDAITSVVGWIVGAILSGIVALVGWAFSLEHRVRDNARAITEATDAQRERDRRIESDIRYIRERLDRALDGN